MRGLKTSINFFMHLSACGSFLEFEEVLISAVISYSEAFKSTCKAIAKNKFSKF